MADSSDQRWRGDEEEPWSQRGDRTDSGGRRDMQEGRGGSVDGLEYEGKYGGKREGEWMDVTVDLVPLPPIPVSSASGGIFVSDIVWEARMSSSGISHHPMQP